MNHLQIKKNTVQSPCVLYFARLCSLHAHMDFVLLFFFFFFLFVFFLIFFHEKFLGILYTW